MDYMNTKMFALLWECCNVCYSQNKCKLLVLSLSADTTGPVSIRGKTYKSC